MPNLDYHETSAYPFRAVREKALENRRKLLFIHVIVCEPCLCYPVATTKRGGEIVAQKTYHTTRSEVYHTDPNCTHGNNIEKKNKRPGTGGKRPCKICSKTKKRR